jgi:peptide/nickel transport system permease protein
MGMRTLSSSAAARPIVLGAPAARGRSWRLGHALRRNKSTTIGGTIVVVLVFLAIAAPLIAPHQPDDQDITRALRPPFWFPGGSMTYPLGTDNLGGDVLSRVIYGTRISLGVGATAVVTAVIVGVAVGLLAGFRGGWIDDLLMGVTEIQLAFPLILLALAIISLVGPSLTNLIVVLGITGWPWYARVLRGEVLSIKERDYVTASRVVGCGTKRTVLRHVLPQVTTSIIILATLQLARMIIYEASLSFLGVGVQPPTPSWGSMISDGRHYLATAWWLATVPGLAITIAMLGINLFGDGLRDLLDPRLGES